MSKAYITVSILTWFNYCLPGNDDDHDKNHQLNGFKIGLAGLTNRVERTIRFIRAMAAKSKSIGSGRSEVADGVE